MKKVILQRKEEVFLDDLTNSSVIGFKTEGIKSLIIHTKNGFTSLDNNGEHPCDNWASNSLKEYIERMSKISPDCIFNEFKTTKDCFKWMSE